MSLPVSFNGERGAIRTKAPRLGEHNNDFPGVPRGGKA
jgi:hypothetical protein